MKSEQASEHAAAAAKAKAALAAKSEAYKKLSERLAQTKAEQAAQLVPLAARITSLQKRLAVYEAPLGSMLAGTEAELEPAASVQQAVRHLSQHSSEQPGSTAAAAAAAAQPEPCAHGSRASGIIKVQTDGTVRVLLEPAEQPAGPVEDAPGCALAPELQVSCGHGSRRAALYV